MKHFHKFYFKELLITLSEVVKAHDDVSNWERQDKAIKMGGKLVSEIDEAIKEGRDTN